jgi:hypothetical protein
LMRREIEHGPDDAALADSPRKPDFASV